MATETLTLPKSGTDDRVRAGSSEFMALFARVGDIGNSTVLSIGEKGGDGRDYRAIVEAVKLSVASNLAHPDIARREGYFRALAGLICVAADGCAPSDGWDPIADSKVAYSFKEPSHG